MAVLGCQSWVMMQLAHLPLSAPQFDGVPSSGWHTWRVDNIDERVKKRRAGAKLMRLGLTCPASPYPILREPGGAGVGWMTPATS